MITPSIRLTGSGHEYLSFKYNRVSKKILLFLFIVIGLNAYAQAPDITVHCGWASINLNDQNIHYIGEQTPQTFIIKYYATQEDAQNDTNVLTFANTYPADHTTTIFVRIQNNVTTEITFDSFQIIVEPAMFITLAQIGFPTSQIIAEVANGTPPYIYQWSVNGTPFQNAPGGVIPIPAGMGGIYTVTVIDSNGCSASQTINIMQNWVHANNDTMEIALTGSEESTSTSSVLDNDYYGTAPVQPGQVQLSSNNLPAGFSLNEDGTVSVLPGTASGTYTFTYTVCEILQNTCSTAIAIVNVISEGFLLHAFVDTNGNGTQDSGEHNFTLGQFHYDVNNSGTLIDVASSTGSHVINESNTANSYDFSFTVNSEYAAQYSIAMASYSDVVYVSGSGIAVYNFAITALPYADLAVAVYNFLTPPRPGFTYKNNILYTNNGTQSMSGTLTFNHDSSVTITEISQAGTVATPTGFTYNFTDLDPQETRSIIVTMPVPTIPTVALGQLLTNTASITQPEGDLIPSNNQNTLAQVIVGSYDPNDKTEIHGGKIVSADFSADDFLTYTIQFENTGTYPAENVKVNDVLDAQLDETSVRMVTSSHPCTLIRDGKNLNWHFNGIDLPPSVTNTTIGHGFLTFKVKPKPGYVVGDLIPNVARIYFDFNPAIVTEPCLTEFVNALATQSFAFDNLQYSPNPVKNILKLSNDTKIEKVTVTSMLGQTVLEQSSNDLKPEVDFSTLSNGVYFVKIVAQNQQKQIKVVKQ
jgi:uncharacterized repeat protein (TIGR01451 family)